MKPPSPRPTSVTVVLWLSSAATVLSALVLPGFFSDAAREELARTSVLPVDVQLGWLIASTIAGFVSIFGMLKARAWARLLYVAVGVLGSAYSLLTQPSRGLALLGAAFFLVSTYVLYRPAATRYFAGTSGARSTHRWMLVMLIVLGLGAGMWLSVPKPPPPTPPNRPSTSMHGDEEQHACREAARAECLDECLARLEANLPEGVDREQFSQGVRAGYLAGRMAGQGLPDGCPETCIDNKWREWGYDCSQRPQ